MAIKYCIFPVRIEQEDFGDVAVIEGIPVGKNYGVFYSNALSFAVVTINLTTKEINEAKKIQGAKVLTKTSLISETTGDEGLKVCDDFSIDILEKRLS